MPETNSHVYVGENYERQLRDHFCYDVVTTYDVTISVSFVVYRVVTESSETYFNIQMHSTCTRIFGINLNNRNLQTHLLILCLLQTTV